MSQEHDCGKFNRGARDAQAVAVIAFLVFSLPVLGSIVGWLLYNCF